MENEEKGVTLGRVFKVAFTNWKLFTPVAVCTAVACFLGINFGLNTFRGSYSSTFSYSSADLANEKYADGSDFSYLNLVSYDNLNKVKESDTKYASINIDKIVDNNAIGITKDSESETYTVTLSYKSLKDQSLAKSFIKDIAESALKKDADIVNNGTYDTSLKQYVTADTFEKKVSYLDTQSSFLRTEYKRLTNTSEETDTQKKSVELPATVTNKITSNLHELDLVAPTTFTTAMNSRIANYGLNTDYSDEAVDKVVSKGTDLTNEKDANQSLIDSYTATISAMGNSGAIAELSQKVETLLLRNEAIKLELLKITKIEDNRGKTPENVTGHTDFVNDLTAAYNGLNDATTGYRNVLKAAYIDNATVNFEKTSVVELKGTVNVFINVALSLVVGVVIGGVVNLIVDRKKLYE